MEILEKHKVKHLKNFLGNFQQKTVLNNFLKSDKDLISIIIGANGVGKTTFVELGLKEHGFTFIRPDYDNFVTHKDFVSYITTFINTTCISNTSKIESNKKAIFIDDINTLILQNRFALSFIEDLCKKLKTIKIIVSVNIEDEKKITDLKKLTTVLIRLQNPPINECLNYILNILETEDFDVDEELLIDLIKTNNCNLRSIFINLDSDETNNDDDNSNEIYHDKNIFDIVNILFKRNDKTLNDMATGISSDPTLISLIMYDNYKDYYYENFKISKKTNTNFFFVNRMFIEGSIIESNAYKNNDLMLVDWANLIKCGSIRAIYNESMVKINPKTLNLKYTTILSRLSQYFSNLKKQNKYNGQHDLSYNNSTTLWNMYSLAKENNKKVTIPKGDATVFYNAILKLK